MEKQPDIKLSIIIPCLNEVATIERAVKAAYESANKYLNSNFEVIVSDNGSTDGTLQKLALIKHIRLLQTPIKGYGSALHYAILEAKYPYVLFADADLSYDFRELHKFLPYIKNNFDLILGSRFKGKSKKNAMPFLNRYLGTPILTFLIKIVYGIKVTDCNSGMRVVKKSFYMNLEMRNNGMEWASELLIRTVLNHGKYAEVPITFYKDQRGKRTHLRRWEDGWRHFKVIVLLKPVLLFYITLIFIFLGFYFLPLSTHSAISMFLFAEFFFLAYLVTKRLESAIYKTADKLSNLIDRAPLVLISVVFTSLGFIQILVIPDTYSIFKYIFLFQVVLFDLWLFFIETVKTHLVNTLK